jgi:molybdate transport system ATP-binding protein
VQPASPKPSPFLAIELVAIHLQRGERRVLRNLHWSINPGERWLLRGNNGAGKTQLLKLLAGDVWPQPGQSTQRTYTCNGESFSEPLPVREEIAYLGAERQDRYEHYHWNHRVLTVVGTGQQRTDLPLTLLARIERLQVLALLRRMGLARLAQRRFLTLSYGERRLVLLARALAWQPLMLLLDEPLNGLDSKNRRRLLSILARLQRTELPIVYATHRLDEAPTGLTHLAVLVDGRLTVSRWRVAQRNDGTVRSRPVRVRGRARYSTDPGDVVDASQALLRLVNASVWREGRAVLRKLSLTLGRGERVVVHGANGSGKSTLLGALYGDFAVAVGGELWRRGVPPGTPLYEFQRQVGRVSPELQLALPRQHTALEIVVAGLRGCYALDSPMSVGERRRGLLALRRLGAAAFAGCELAALSYGQVRRVLFARALAGEPSILLLDEPYTGLDASTRSAIRALLHAKPLRHTAIVMATHHRDDWPATVTQELELAGGVVRYLGAARGVTARRNQHVEAGR